MARITIEDCIKQIPVAFNSRRAPLIAPVSCCKATHRKSMLTTRQPLHPRCGKSQPVKEELKC